MEILTIKGVFTEWKSFSILRKTSLVSIVDHFEDNKSIQSYAHWSCNTKKVPVHVHQ